MSFRRWHWLEDGLLPLAVLTMRLCWLWPWLELLRRWITPHATIPFLPLPALVLLSAGGYLVSRRALENQKVSAFARGAVIALGLVAILTLIWWHYVAGLYTLWDWRGFARLAFLATDWSLGPPPVFLALVLGVSMWTQGVRDATPLSRHELVWTTFTVGFAAFVVMLLVVQLDDRGLPPGAGAAIWLFFGVGMAGLALSALEYAGLGQQQHAAIPGMSRYWLGSMLAVVGAILGFGLLLALVLAPGTIAAAFGHLRFLLDWLGTIVGLILIVFAYLIFLILEPIFNFIQQRLQLPEPEEGEMETQSLNDMLEAFGEEPTNILPEAVADSLPWLGILLTVLALALAVHIALRILRRDREESFVETRESVFSADLLQEQLSSLWQRFMGAPDSPGPDPFLSLRGEEERRRTVRAIYQEFLAQMQASGHPRPPHLTPVAYGQYLQTVLSLDEEETIPEASDAIQALTRGYMQARYGDTGPTIQEVQSVQEAWAQLRKENENEQNTTAN